MRSVVYMNGGCRLGAQSSTAVSGLVRLSGVTPDEDRLARALERFVNERFLEDPGFLYRGSERWGTELSDFAGLDL